DELESQLREGGEAAGELFGGLIYRRVLLRIGDEVARSLAFPGLVLRYVTTDLIRKVLVPALKLPPLDETAARPALAALASYNWLAYRRGNDEVWHRSDLRRSMLKVMIAQEPDKARRIHRAAVRYFATAGTDSARIEGLYHSLMLKRTPKDDVPVELAQLKGV